MRTPVIDADGHVHEPADAWERHLAPEWRAYAPRTVRDEQGRVRQVVGGEMEPYIPVPESGDWDVPTGGHDPKQRLADMDRQGVERSLLYSHVRPVLRGPRARRRPGGALPCLQRLARRVLQR